MSEEGKLEERLGGRVGVVDNSDTWRSRIKRLVPDRLINKYEELGRDFLKAYIVYDISYRLVCATIAASVTGKLWAAIPALYAPGVTTTGVPVAAAYTKWRSKKRKDKVEEA